MKGAVSKQAFEQAIDHIASVLHRSVDTETTGLAWAHDDKLFSVIFQTEFEGFYFNFNDDPSIPEEYRLPREWVERFSPCFDKGVTFAHNAKFDWHMLEKAGCKVRGDMWCTLTGARILDNDVHRYGLAECAERIGLEKDEAVEAYIKEHKLWDWITIPGKQNRKKNKYYDRVPFHIIVPYGLRDASVTYRLGMKQLERVEDLDNSRPENRRSLANVFLNEVRLTRVCKEMEDVGIEIDKEYCEKAIEHDEAVLKLQEEEYEKLTEIPFKDSNKTHADAFRNLGCSYPLTEKGNPSFNDESLSKVDHPIATVIKAWRTAFKRSNTYFRSYLYYGRGGVIRANINQGGTTTGRFSYSDPNLQNIPKADTSEFPVRRAFVPRDGFCFVAIDYNQMEFRLMLDYAKEYSLIEAIKQGHDPHDATAKEVGIERRPAKILNFGLLYGMGVDLLARTLGVDREQASQFKRKYFSRLPRVKQFLHGTSDMAASRGFVYGWDGRRYQFHNADLSYKAANAIIQGGCASIVKQAMVRCAALLQPLESKLLLQIHDELLFEVAENELGVVADLKEIMEDIYPYKAMPLTCSVEHSWKSFGDLEKGAPHGS